MTAACAWVFTDAVVDDGSAEVWTELYADVVALALDRNVDMLTRCTSLECVTGVLAQSLEDPTSRASMVLGAGQVEALWGVVSDEWRAARGGNEGSHVAGEASAATQPEAAERPLLAALGLLTTLLRGRVLLPVKGASGAMRGEAPIGRLVCAVGLLDELSDAARPLKVRAYASCALAPLFTLLAANSGDGEPLLTVLANVFASKGHVEAENAAALFAQQVLGPLVKTAVRLLTDDDGAVRASAARAVARALGGSAAPDEALVTLFSGIADVCRGGDETSYGGQDCLRLAWYLVLASLLARPASRETVPNDWPHVSVFVPGAFEGFEGDGATEVEPDVEASGRGSSSELQQVRQFEPERNNLWAEEELVITRAAQHLPDVLETLRSRPGLVKICARDAAAAVQCLNTTERMQRAALARSAREFRASAAGAYVAMLGSYSFVQAWLDRLGAASSDETVEALRAWSNRAADRRFGASGYLHDRFGP